MFLFPHIPFHVALTVLQGKFYNQLCEDLFSRNRHPNMCVGLSLQGKKLYIWQGYSHFPCLLESGIAITACKTFLNNTLKSLQEKKKSWKLNCWICEHSITNSEVALFSSFDFCNREKKVLHFRGYKCTENKKRYMRHNFQSARPSERKHQSFIHFFLLSSNPSDCFSFHPQPNKLFLH